MKILVIAMSGIGDTLIATPLLHELRANFPQARLDALVMWAGAKDLLEGNPHVNTVHQKNLIKEGVRPSLPFLLGLRRERYDLSINAHTQGRIHYRLLARFIGAQRRVSHAYENASPLDRLLVHQTIPQDYMVHSVENNHRLLPLVGAQTLRPAHEMEVYLTPAEVEWARTFAADHQLSGRRMLGLHVGSGGTKNLALKRWPLEHYIALLQQLLAAHPQVEVLLFGGPEEKEAHARIHAGVANANILIPETRNLRQAAALLKRCHAFLSVDTALMHLAAAVQVPNQIVIEAMTLNATNVPAGNKFTLVRNPVVNGRSLDYYRYDGGPIRGTDAELIAAMNSVTVEAVMEAIQSSKLQAPSSR